MDPVILGALDSAAPGIRRSRDGALVTLPAAPAGEKAYGFKWGIRRTPATFPDDNQLKMYLPSSPARSPVNYSSAPLVYKFSGCFYMFICWKKPS